MKVLTVLPITNNKRLDELTYFSLKDIPLGSVVQVPVRNKSTPALVIKSKDANKMKAILRSSNFSLKRIGVHTPTLVLPEPFIQTAIYLSKYYATSTGSIIFAMLPKNMINKTNLSGIDMTNIKTEHNETLPETFALQAPFIDRVTVYKNIVREAFARKESVLIISPTIVNATTLYQYLSKRIEKRVFVLTSKNTEKQQKEIFNNMHNSEKSVLLIATAKYAALFRKDLHTIILEDESSSYYETLKTPYINQTLFYEEYARICGIKLIRAGTVLSTKTHDLLNTGEILELAPPNTRVRSQTKVKIIDTRTPKPNPNATAKEKMLFDKKKKEPFSAISTTLHTKIQKVLKNQESICILTPRKGLAPLTVCRDCKTPVICTVCNKPITLRKINNKKNEFLCYTCGETGDPNTTCSYCDSWRLDTLGIGIEMVEEELKKTYTQTPIHIIHKDATKTERQIRNTLERFNTEKGILLCTQAALPFITNKTHIHMSVITSLDAMLSVPSFEIDEKVFSLILNIKDITKDTLYIQTRMPERTVLKKVSSGDIAGFMRNELALRKILQYPPYTIMIKITKTGSKKQIIQDFTKIMPEIEPYGPRIFKEFYQLSPSKFALHALLRIPAKNYPNPALTETLKNIQPLFEVKVNIE